MVSAVRTLARGAIAGRVAGPRKRAYLVRERPSVLDVVEHVMYLHCKKHTKAGIAAYSDNAPHVSLHVREKIMWREESTRARRAPPSPLPPPLYRLVEEQQRHQQQQQRRHSIARNRAAARSLSSTEEPSRGPRTATSTTQGRSPSEDVLGSPTFCREG